MIDKVFWFIKDLTNYPQLNATVILANIYIIIFLHVIINAIFKIITVWNTRTRNRIRY